MVIAAANEAKTNDYQVKWSAGEMTDYIIRNNRDESATIMDGQIASADGLDIKICLPDSNTSQSALMVIRNAETGYSDFTVTPENEDNIDATFYFEDYALSVNADADAAEFKEDGSINLENADGIVDVGLTLNHSQFDFVMIKGQADGEVQIELDEDCILIKGRLSDFNIRNMDRDGNISKISVEGNKEIKAYMEVENGELSMTYEVIKDSLC